MRGCVWCLYTNIAMTFYIRDLSIQEKFQSFIKASTSVLLTMPTSLTVWITINCGKRDGNTRPPDLPLEKSVCTDQEATVRTGQGTTDWFQIRKGVCQGCILSPCLFNLYAEYIKRNIGLDEAQARIKIAGRNINNLRYADDTTLKIESEEKLKRPLMKVKEESEKVSLKSSTFRKLRSWHLVPSLHGK